MTSTGWRDTLCPRLEGRLVLVEPLTVDDEEGLWAVADDDEVWRHMPTTASASRAAFHAWIASALGRAAAGLDVPFCVRERASGVPIGSTRYLALRPEHRGLEIGFTWMARRTWRTGANAETKLLLLEHAFERLGAMRVEFKTDARNERSRAALAALPARFEGVFAKHMLVRGAVVRDSAWYAIVDDEWPDVKQALATRVDRAVESARGS